MRIEFYTIPEQSISDTTYIRSLNGSKLDGDIPKIGEIIDLLVYPEDEESFLKNIEL